MTSKLTGAVLGVSRAGPLGLPILTHSDITVTKCHEDQHQRASDPPHDACVTSVSVVMMYLSLRDPEVPGPGGGLTPQTQVGQSGGHTSGTETSTGDRDKNRDDTKSMSMNRKHFERIKENKSSLML